MDIRPSLPRTLAIPVPGILSLPLPRETHCPGKLAASLPGNCPCPGKLAASVLGNLLPLSRELPLPSLPRETFRPCPGKLADLLVANEVEDVQCQESVGLCLDPEAFWRQQLMTNNLE